MMLRMTSAACTLLAGLSLAGAALAADPLTVKLEQPVPAEAKLIAGSVMFTCRGDVCTAPKPASRTYAAATCRDLAKAFGPVTAFSNSRAEFDGEKLADCNSVASGDQPQFAER